MRELVLSLGRVMWAEAPGKDGLVGMGREFESQTPLVCVAVLLLPSLGTFSLSDLSFFIFEIGLLDLVSSGGFYV